MHNQYLMPFAMIICLALTNLKGIPWMEVNAFPDGSRSSSSWSPKSKNGKTQSSDFDPMAPFFDFSNLCREDEMYDAYQQTCIRIAGAAFNIVCGKDEHFDETRQRCFPDYKIDI